MKTEIVSFNYLGVFATIEILEACHHSGQCDQDVLYYLPQFIALNTNICREKLKLELREYGTWDNEELNNHNDNMSRILWIAAGNWQDEQFENSAQIISK